MMKRPSSCSFIETYALFRIWLRRLRWKLGWLVTSLIARICLHSGTQSGDRLWASIRTRTSLRLIADPFTWEECLLEHHCLRTRTPHSVARASAAPSNASNIDFG